MATRQPDHQSREHWKEGIKDSAEQETLGADVTRLVLSTNPKPTRQRGEPESEDRRVTLWLAWRIASRIFVLISAHREGPIPLPWPKPLRGTGLSPYTASERPTPVEM